MTTITEEDLITTTCVYEINRLGTTTECGIELPDNADHDQLFCAWHDGAVDRGDITWEEYTTYRRHHA